MFSYQIANKYSGAAYGKLIVDFQKQDLRHQKNKKTEELKGVQNLPKNSWRFFLARQNEIRAEDAGACEGRNVQTTTILSPQKRWLNLWPI